MMLVQGGYYSENKEVLKDVALYDIDQDEWIAISQP
jgi:hypothetical protein